MSEASERSRTSTSSRKKGPRRRRSGNASHSTANSGTSRNDEHQRSVTVVSIQPKVPFGDGIFDLDPNADQEDYCLSSLLMQSEDIFDVGCSSKSHESNNDTFASMEPIKKKATKQRLQNLTKAIQEERRIEKDKERLYWKIARLFSESSSLP